MTIGVGDRIPAATFKVMGDEGPRDVTTAEFCGGKKVALFGLPGAYTPVCSAQHLPEFVAKADALKAKGIDSIGCISVNDPFVMSAWGKEHGAGDKVTMLADCTGEFTRAAGLALDLSAFGLGERSERYSMIVDDGVVTAINVEESVLACGVSNVDTLLAQA